MIKSLNIIQYKKLKNICISFSGKVNIISGTNGTCKTSILHLIGNSLQSPNVKKCDWIKDTKCLSVIKAINSVTNPKVESLTRGDRKYNDPAYGVKGTLFSVNYVNDKSLEFRRHNSARTFRYAIKPKYRSGTNETLPYCPVIYLGLSRLVPFGEFNDDEQLAKISKKLPPQYQNEIVRIYKEFTNYEIDFKDTQQMGNIKVRNIFYSNVDGIDSNTISAGEDNLNIILTALISLKYYYESIESTKDIESVLLIDEIDATLHPAFQIKLLSLLREMSEQYKIQIVFTSHSMSLLEEMLLKKDNVIYLVDNVTSIVEMESPDIYKIKMHLHSLTHNDIYADKVIPIFTEDDEARFILDMLFDYYNNNCREFRKISTFFHKVYVNISAENLSGIFSDSKLTRTTMRSICILDGDHNSDLSNCIIVLPGKKSPEQVLLDYAKQLYENDDSFWIETIVIEKGYGKVYYIDKIQKKVDAFEEEIKSNKEKGVSTKGEIRLFNKRVFNENKGFFELLFKHWMNNAQNKTEIEQFYSDLRVLFKKVAQYHEINPKEWS